MKTNRQSGIALATTIVILFLIAALIAGFSWMVMMDQRLGGTNGTGEYAFYGAEAGLEKLTTDLGNLFSVNPSPSGAQVHTLDVLAKTPVIGGIQYLNPNGSLGYQISFPTDGSGDPLAQNHVIQSGNYQGMTGLLTPYTLTVTAHDAASNSEVRLTREVQTVSIPVFQFGMFSQTDLSFFAGPNFNFGGRVHTNGNLFLASGAQLYFFDKVTAAGQVVRQTLSNNWPTSNGYTGDVFVPTTAGGCNSTPSTTTAGCRILAPTEGSVTGNIGAWSPNNPTWSNLTGGTGGGTYNGYLKAGVQPLNLSITLAGGANPIDLIRRPVQGEDASNAALLSQRYYSEASVRILLSDNPTDITSLPCVSAGQPVLLGQAVPVATPLTFGSGTSGNPPVPVAESGASGGSYSATNGYWEAANTPTVTGYIKIEIQTAYAVPPAACGTWKDVTAEVLGFGIAGRNINPSTGYGNGNYGAGYLPSLPGAQLGSDMSGCAQPSPNAIIRLERIRDNPSTGKSYDCGFASNGKPSTVASDYWPNALFDAREGNPRDVVPSGAYAAMPTPGGVMDYTELDIGNLAKYLTGVLAGSGTGAKDPNNSSYDFVVYFSDRRTNYTATPVAAWPPQSPTGFETGEYGFEDSINPGNAWGCPNGVLDTGETFDQAENSANQQVGGVPEDYGEQSPMWKTPSSTTPSPFSETDPLKGTNVFPQLFTNVISSGAIKANPNCGGPHMPWPFAYIANAQEARENPPIFFRRALKIVDASSISLGVCPDGVNCGLTIVSENPVYVEGDFNATPGSSTPFNGSHVATSVVADAVTLLSDNWNDVNSFSSPYSLSNRQAVTTGYRFGVVAGKGIAFGYPGTCGTAACYQDFGTDGGVHNFLRFLENWGGQTLNYQGSIVSFYYNRQAIGEYKCCTTVYSAPTRGYNFDSEFLSPTLLPPRTPMFRTVNTIGFTQTVLPTP